MPGSLASSQFAAMKSGITKELGVGGPSIPSISSNAGSTSNIPTPGGKGKVSDFDASGMKKLQTAEQGEV